MRLCRRWVSTALLAVPLLDAQTSVDLRTQAKSVDFSAAAYTKPSKTGAALPSTCSAGETFFLTSAAAGHNLFGCTATNTWTLLGANLWFGGGAANAADCAQFDGNGNLVSAGAPCGRGYVVLTAGSGPPAANCSAPSSTNLVVYLDSANGDEWWCYAANAWKKTLSVTGSGPYQVTGTTGTAPGLPASGSVACYFDSGTNTQVCIDSNGNAFTMTKGTAAAAHQFVTNVDGAGVQHVAQPAFSDLTGSATPSQMPNVPVLVSAGGPVADPGGASYYLYNNAVGPITFDLPSGVAGMQRCYRSATGKSGAITIAVASGNAIDLNGSNGSVGTGTLTSSGAAGDAVCLVSDAANHWYAYVQKGAWSNN